MRYVYIFFICICIYIYMYMFISECVRWYLFVAAFFCIYVRERVCVCTDEQDVVVVDGLCVSVCVRTCLCMRMCVCEY